VDTRLELLSAARINAIFQGLQDPRLLPQELVWNQRVPLVNALDEEIIARSIETIQISDIVADDAAAVVYSQGKFQYETTKIPNIKHGIAMSQTMMNQVWRIVSQMGPGGNTLGMFDSFAGWENRTLRMVDLGVRQRMEALLIGMLTDNFNYDKLGIKLSGLTWGMPSDLKVTAGIDWSTSPTTATPITDIQTLIRVARIRYGAYYDRLTMSTQTLQYLQATTQFQNQAKLFGWGLVNVTPAIPVQADSTIIEMLGKMLGGAVKIELYDARYWAQDSNGYTTSYPFFPINQVLFTDSRGDNDARYYDFANTVVTESIVANATQQVNLMSNMPIGPGPMAYATANPNLNPPNIVYWGVCRGFPRKHILQSSAVLTAGAWTDPSIAVGVPFPS
jgi:hypothetical protein